MILWPFSPRHVPLERAAEIGAALKRRAEVAGVFVNPTLDEVVTAADVAGLTLLQFHGDEGPVFCTEAARRTGCKVIKAARVRSNADIQAVTAFRVDYHLLDSYKAGVPGGTGETFEWDLVAGAMRTRKGGPKLILSGGLTPENVGEAIRVVRPYAVDVASGTEIAPGVKSAELIAQFAQAVADAVPTPVESAPSELL
jgi:phosphoribosylanthranilate isomerase